MADEQRFSLSMTYRNIKDNKITIIIFIGVFLTLGLYITYPLLMFAAGERVTQDLGFLMGRVQNDSHNSALKEMSSLFNNSAVTFNFTSVITPPQCEEENVFGLGENVFLSICKSTLNNINNVIIDIRKFTGTLKTGIKPTIVGINLTLKQWYVLSNNINAIDDTVIDLSQ